MKRERAVSIAVLVILVLAAGASPVAAGMNWDAAIYLWALGMDGSTRVNGQDAEVDLSFGDIAASGGYYVASVGAEIFATPNTLTGSIGIYAGTFALDATVTPAAAGGNGAFGFSVAVQGNEMLVGAPLMDTAVPFSGAAFKYKRTSGTWNLQAQHVAADANSNASFGIDVSLDSIALVGADNDTNPNGTSAGAAYVFEACP